MRCRTRDWNCSDEHVADGEHVDPLAHPEKRDNTGQAQPKQLYERKFFWIQHVHERLEAPGKTADSICSPLENEQKVQKDFKIFTVFPGRGSVTEEKNGSSERITTPILIPHVMALAAGLVNRLPMLIPLGNPQWTV
jgi:hypothetical protein